MLFGVGFAEVSKLLSKLWPAVCSNGVRPAERVEDIGELIGDFGRLCAVQLCEPGIF